MYLFGWNDEYFFVYFIVGYKVGFQVGFGVFCEYVYQGVVEFIYVWVVKLRGYSVNDWYFVQ